MRHTHEHIRGNNRLTHGGQWRNSRNVIMVHEARKVVTAIMGNCPRRTVPQWRISLPLTTDCPNTSCSPRQDNERPLSGSGSLYSLDVVYQHRLDDGPSPPSVHSISSPSPLPVTRDSGFLTLPPLCTPFLAAKQPLDKPSDLYEDYVDLLLEPIASDRGRQVLASSGKRRWGLLDSRMMQVLRLAVIT